MRQTTIAIVALVGTLGGPQPSLAQPPAAVEPDVQSVRVPFSDPSRPGRLKIDLISGSITVRAHAEPDAVFEISVPASHRDNAERNAGGLFVVASNSFNFELTEQDNVITMDMSPRGGRRVSVTVMVPVQTSLELSTVNSGHIAVEGVTGDLELTNVNGRIEATDVSGSVVAETVNGAVTVTFNEITPDRFMAFSTLNGKIDVTFPSDVRADLHLDTQRGSIFSDFELALDPSPTTVREDVTGGGTRITVERTVRGTLNGGGPEMRFKSYNGSIYIRSSDGRSGG